MLPWPLHFGSPLTEVLERVMIGLEEEGALNCLPVRAPRPKMDVELGPKKGSTLSREIVGDVFLLASPLLSDDTFCFLFFPSSFSFPCPGWGPVVPIFIPKVRVRFRFLCSERLGFGDLNPFWPS